MKVYNLSCERHHHFEGWFSSEEDASAQLQQEQIECPICESRTIRKMLSAPRLNLSGAQAPQSASSAPSAQSGHSAQSGQSGVPADLQAKLMEAARRLLADTEDVGERFVEEARRIHYKEAPHRGIRGVASTDECAELADEGIEVIQVSLPAALKQPLQ